MSIVELAAWVIIGQAAGRFIFSSIDEKRQRIQRGAAKAEYESLENAAYRIPEGEPESTRTRLLARYRERQQQLLIRYPDTLIRIPDPKYFLEAEEEDKRTHPPFLTRMKEELYLYAMSVAALIIGHFLWPVITGFFSGLFR